MFLSSIAPFLIRFHVFFVQLASSIKENPKLRAAAEELRKAGVQVGDAVSEALKSMEESEVMRAVRLWINSVTPMLRLNHPTCA